jgi:hypothetical protein
VVVGEGRGQILTRQLGSDQWNVDREDIRREPMISRSHVDSES